MKTLSFREVEIGRNPARPLIKVNSESDEIRFRSGLQLIVAPNGYGKSTLLQTVGGILQPLKGRMHISESGESRPLLAERDVLYVSEYLSFPKFIYPREWISFMAEGSGHSVESAIQGFSMESQMGHYLGRLSQGERRKVTWLGADASQKPVLLLDEPLDGLDLLAIRCARELVQSWRERKRVVCVIAHQVGELLDLSDEVFLIHEGRLKTWKAATGSDYRALSPDAFRDALLKIYAAR